MWVWLKIADRRGDQTAGFLVSMFPPTDRAAHVGVPGGFLSRAM